MASFVNPVPQSDKQRIVPVMHHAASEAITRPLCLGTAHTNKGAGDTIVISLPEASPGMHATFVVVANEELRVDPATGETVGSGSAGEYIAADAVGESISLLCVDAGAWTIAASTGTWTIEGA